MIFFDKNENVIFEIRKHWIMFWGQIFVIIIFAMIPLLFSPVLFLPEVSLKLASLIVFVFSIWYLILWISCLTTWTNYYLDVWIITNHKILSIDQKGLFSRSVSVLHLDKIQDISYKVNGLIASMMNYGDIEVKTAGHIHEDGFVMRGIANPAFVQARINEALINHKTETHEEALREFADVVEVDKSIDDLINPKQS